MAATKMGHLFSSGTSAYRVVKIKLGASDGEEFKRTSGRPLFV